ncbi:MAG: M20/M25/M40 family metallo-hydrolase [Ruminococcus sp.]|nr:M20/M25/M40 family metallo-hydrolase [Ruminococcus sp.]
MNLTEILRILSQAEGVSGWESPAGEKALELLRDYCPDAKIDPSGNIIGHMGNTLENAPHILLDAHLDQVGLIVTAITDEGFVRADHVGGIDMRLMPAQNLLLHGKKTIPGVAASVPPHLIGGEQKVLDVTELLIDTGYSKAELEEILSPGDRISFDTPFQILQGDRIAARSMDDRCGMAAILYALELLKNKTLPCKVSVLFSAQEEVGECGAETAGYTINPDMAIAVDVTFAMGHGDDPVKCGKLGGGPMIGISPTLSREISDSLISAAEGQNIPWQPEVMSGTTGTNADRFSVSRGGVRSCTLSIPLRYMHTPSEVISLGDVENTGRLLAAWLKEGHYAE